jgi:hypothetical protein
VLGLFHFRLSLSLGEQRQDYPTKRSQAAPNRLDLIVKCTKMHSLLLWCNLNNGTPTASAALWEREREREMHISHNWLVVLS